MMAVSEGSSKLLKAEAHIWNQTFNFKNSACLKCAVQLGIADAIEKHGKLMTLSELSSALPIHPSKSLYINRLMRILVNSGFFVEQRLAPLTNGNIGEDEEVIIGYALTPAACLLLQDEPLNARDLVLMVLDPVMVKPWNALTEWFQNDDETPFDTAHGKNFWDYNAQEPRLRKLFNEAMASDSHLITKVLMQDCKFAFEGLTSLVDVGGGTGTVARAIAKTFPTLKCTVFDLPHVVANQEPAKNLDFVAGDMLENIPSANSVLLKWILHDWSDEDCVKILRNCKNAIPARENGGKLIIIDMVMESQQQDNNTVEAQISLDMQMLILYNAKERTEKEWTTLFWEAGFSGYKIFPILGSRSLIEVYP